VCGKAGNKFCVMLGKNEMERKNVELDKVKASKLDYVAAANVASVAAAAAAASAVPGKYGTF